MLINKYTTYNPKIDYLICKSLIDCLPKKYDEYDLRNVYFERKKPVEDYEKDILKIKQFFYENDASNLSIYKMKKLIKLIVKKDVFIKNDYFSIDNGFCREYLYRLVKDACEYRETVRGALIKIGILLSSLKRDEIPVIPFRNIVRKIQLTEDCDHDFIDKIYYRLITKKNKYSFKHDLLDNVIAINTLKDNVNEIGCKFLCEQIGIYGSFSTNEANEYSDLDLLLVVKDNLDKEKIKKEATLFIKKIINIPVDIKVSHLTDLNESLTIGMKKSLKVIWGK